MTTERRIATRKEAAEFLRVSDRTIENYVTNGKLKARRIGRYVRFEWADLEALIDG
jgi:excisionase family DNA binding protein